MIKAQTKRLLTVICMAAVASQAYGVENKPINKVPVQNTYVSEIDRALTIHKVGVLPATDNVEGLYARYLENNIIDYIKKSHRFNFVELKEVSGKLSVSDYESQPELIKKTGRANGVDALVAGYISKTKNGIDITIDLYLTYDGQLFLQETIVGEPHFQTTGVEKKSTEMLNKLVQKIPYNGLILSRQGNRVTLDIGASDGLRDNSVVSVEQIIAVKRHPKHGFLVSSEKEIMGKIRIVKADETLSFAVVVQERDQGVIGPNSKITGLDFVNYADTTFNNPRATPESGLSRDSVSFGKNPREWLPQAQPTFGKISLSLGLGSLKNSLTTVDQTTSTQTTYSGNTPLYPQIDLSGELWITPAWFVGTTIRQGILTVTNPESSGTPSTLSMNNSLYDFNLGYRFLLQDDFWGPQININTGFAKYSTFIDASTPLTFTSTSYSGLYIGVGGAIPITADRTWVIDVALRRFLFPTLTETPVASAASSDNSITTFSLGGSYRLANNYLLLGHVNLDFYSSTYSGVGTRGSGSVGLNASTTLITFISGIAYMF